MENTTIRIAADALVVLAGPSGSGKSTWAARWFRPSQIVSSDALRAVVGEHQHDLRASADAFAVLDLVIERRLARGLCVVVDTLGMDRAQLDRWLAMAADHGRPTHLIRFDEDPKTVRSRNRSRPDAVPSKVLSAQLERWADGRDEITAGFDHVDGPGPAALVPRSLMGADGPAGPQHLRFGLLISAFDWPGGAAAIGPRLGGIAAEAERAGFDSVWVMDHFMQIPQVGREWDPMLEALTTLGYLAASTSRVRIGTMVACVSHRSLGHLGRAVATLDVLSQGRAMCGLGLGWFEREHRAVGLRFPPVDERYELLEDALQFLPLQWGPGAPAFEGRRFATPEAVGYPRPIQDRVPILVGGSGERRTLRLVAEYADACNLFGEPDVVARKVDALHRHCATIGRDPAEVEITQLSPVLVAEDAVALGSVVEERRGSNESPEVFIERNTAGTVEHHVDRFGRLAAAGVDTAIVSLADVGRPGAVAGFGAVIDALRP